MKIEKENEKYVHVSLLTDKCREHCTIVVVAKSNEEYFLVLQTVKVGFLR